VSGVQQAANAEDNSEERWAALFGEELKLKVIDIDRKRNRLILSERLAMREWRRKQKLNRCAKVMSTTASSAALRTLAPLWTWAGLTV